MSLYPELRAFFRERETELDRIPAGRRRPLDSAASFVTSRHESHDKAQLTFICTHNSRRSHMAQLWAKAASLYCDVPGVETFSGGTEATAFHPNAVAALRGAGFRIEPTTVTLNPIYEVRYGEAVPADVAYSKIFLEPPNPSTGFLAVMTCTDADAACPYVRGATKRISLPYDDPEAFDETDRASEMYEERSRQIAREWLFALSRVRTRRSVERSSLM